MPRKAGSRYLPGHANSSRPRPTLRERLLSGLAIDPSGCVLWTRSKDGFGYGQIYADGHLRKVHIVMWEMFEGPVPEGLELDHVKARGCSHKNCASIAHLRLSDVIEMRVSAEGAPNWEVAMPVADIVEPNGDQLLWQLAG